MPCGITYTRYLKSLPFPRVIGAIEVVLLGAPWLGQSLVMTANLGSWLRLCSYYEAAEGYYTKRTIYGWFMLQCIGNLIDCIILNDQ
jgi:hypothetical protein